MARDERSLDAVPQPVFAALIFSLALQIAWQASEPRPVARAEALLAPPPAAILRVASLGEPVPLAQLTTLYLQSFDNQPGISIPFRELDYPLVIRWLATILDVDPVGQYPLMMAAELYAQVPDPARARMMFDFVYQQFLRDPDRRWRWLAHAAIVARHRLKDPELALHYAREIARRAPHAPGWARQMHILLLADMGEVESAKILLGALLSSGEVRDEHEKHFLLGRLEAMENAGKSSPPSKN